MAEKKNMCLNFPVVLFRVVIPKNMRKTKTAVIVGTLGSDHGRTRQVAELAAQVGVCRR